MAVAVAGAVGAIILRHFHVQLLSVASRSMEPVIVRGDALVVESVKPQNLRVGDIVSYQSPNLHGEVITHRIVDVNQARGLFTTAGDKRRSPDPSISNSLIIGRVVARAPYAGLIIDFFKKPIGIAIFVFLPAVVLILTELSRLYRQLTRPANLLDYNYDSERTRQEA